MKIYPGNHRLKFSEETVVSSLPLAHIAENNEKYEARIKVNDEFVRVSEKKPVYPYASFDNNSILFFDENGKAVTGSDSYLLKQSDDRFIFSPKNSVEFIPEEFTYELVMKREAVFSSSISYNISVACTDKDMAEHLIGLLNGKSYLKPKNIIINDDSMFSESLINKSLAGTDFLFIKLDELTDELLESCFDNHVNIWAVTDSELFIEDPDIENYVYEENMVYSRTVHAMNGYDCVKADMQKIEETFAGVEALPVNLFKYDCPVALLHKPGKSFMAISHSSIIDSLDTCYEIFFEILMKIYLNTYCATKRRTEYITDKKIDYYVTTYRKTDMYHPRINLKQLFNEDGIDGSIPYENYEMVIDRDDVRYLGMTKNKDLLFKKTSSSDPVKGDNDVSVFTANRTVINFSPAENLLYIIEDKLDIFYDGKFITVAPFRSSSNNINHRFSQRLELIPGKEYELCYNRLDESFFTVEASAYNEAGHGKSFASLVLELETKLGFSDIRMPGGGEIDASGNYEMIDTGCIKGRPYRIGSSNVIKLPARFREHRGKIMQELEKHKSSGDFFMLVFE